MNNYVGFYKTKKERYDLETYCIDENWHLFDYIEQDNEGVIVAPMRLEEIDYKFLEMVFKRNDMKYHVDGYVKFSIELIEEWEEFKKDEFCYNYSTEDHERNRKLLDEYNKQGYNVYLTSE
jgi:hypothetical protein